MFKAISITIGLILLIVISLFVFSCKETNSIAASFIPHPDDISKTIEYYVKQPKGIGAFPAIIFIHGHQVGVKPGGKDFVDWGVIDQYANRGFVAVSISQPGYGSSDGPADYCGVFTQNAVIAVIEKLESEGVINPNQIIIEGISRGAVVAGLVAAKKETITGVILISGVFDFISYKEEAKTEETKKSIVNTMIAEIGDSEDALETRSVINSAYKIKANVLILNGEKDDRTIPRQARELSDEINKHGGKASCVIFQNAGHRIPLDERNMLIDSFISNTMGLETTP